MPRVLATDEYEATDDAAALLRESTVVCLDGDDDGEVRLIPRESVVSVEGDTDACLRGGALPE